MKQYKLPGPRFSVFLLSIILLLSTLSCGGGGELSSEMEPLTQLPSQLAPFTLLGHSISSEVMTTDTGMYPVGSVTVYRFISNSAVYGEGIENRMATAGTATLPGWTWTRTSDTEGVFYLQFGPDGFEEYTMTFTSQYGGTCIFEGQQAVGGGVKLYFNGTCEFTLDKTCVGLDEVSCAGLGGECKWSKADLEPSCVPTGSWDTNPDNFAEEGGETAEVSSTPQTGDANTDCANANFDDTNYFAEAHKARLEARDEDPDDDFDGNTDGVYSEQYDSLCKVAGSYVLCNQMEPAAVYCDLLRSLIEETALDPIFKGALLGICPHCQGLP